MNLFRKSTHQDGFALLVIVVIIAVLGIGGIIIYSIRPKNVAAPTFVAPSNENGDTPQDSIYSFATPKKAAHYESNTPEHGVVLAGVPVNVVIDFNFDLAKPSEIRVYSSGVKNPATGTTSPIEISVGETVIDTNKLSMRRAIDPQAPDDKYTVDYNACWPDGSCHEGSFEFAIDRRLINEFTDMTGETEVTINMDNVEYLPMKVLISSGTKVTWHNNDVVEHYVNTDSHPAHTYELDHNSTVLSPGETYSYTFDKPGIYPYHCSAHADTMTGFIMVE